MIDSLLSLFEFHKEIIQAQIVVPNSHLLLTCVDLYSSQIPIEYQGIENKYI